MGRTGSIVSDECVGMQEGRQAGVEGESRVTSPALLLEGMHSSAKQSSSTPI